MMHQLSKYKLLSVAILSLMLAACSSRVDVVNQKMQEVHNQPPQPVPPAPVFLPVPAFIYAAQQERSPFMPPSLAQELKVMAGKRVMPDIKRPPQFLEQFPIESLTMKGTLKKTVGALYALIQTPDGSVVRVEKGNYMGKNYGRISEIKPGQMTVIEIVPDGRNGFVERPRNLVMIDAGS